MNIVTLYKYNRPDGGLTISPIKPDGEYTESYRLIADEGKELVKGDIRTSCVDVDDKEGWEEVDAIVEEVEGLGEVLD